MRPIVAPEPGGRTLPTTTSLGSAPPCDLYHHDRSLPNGRRVDLAALDNLDEDGLEEVLMERVLEPALLGLVLALPPLLEPAPP